MINLLPLKNKQELLLKKKEKLAVVLGSVILIFLICLALILLSIKFYVLVQADYQKDMLKQVLQKEQTPDGADLSSVIQKYNGILAQLDSFYKKEIYFNQALKIITDVPSPMGLYLANFSLNRDESGKIKANVRGVSDTRDNLLIFKNNIEGDTAIKNPYFSPDSWINPKNVNFSLTFEIDANKQQ